MKTKEIHASVKWPFKVGDYQFGSVEIGEVIEVDEGEDPDRIRSCLVEMLKNQTQEKIGQMLEEWGMEPCLVKPTGPSSVRRRRDG